MTTTKRGARDFMFALAMAEWNAATTDIIGTRGDLRFQGKVEAIPDAGKVWARLSMQSVMERQSHIGRTPKEGGGTQHRRTAIGTFYVQMFAPINTPGIEDKLQAVAERVKNALARSSSSGTVWLRNARINDLPADDTNHRLNVVADYEYDELV